MCLLLCVSLILISSRRPIARSKLSQPQTGCPNWDLCFPGFPHRLHNSQKPAWTYDKHAKLATIRVQPRELELFSLMQCFLPWTGSCVVVQSFPAEAGVHDAKLLLGCLFNPPFRHRWARKLCFPLKIVLAVITPRRTQVFLSCQVCHRVPAPWVSPLRARVSPVIDIGPGMRTACKEKQGETSRSIISIAEDVSRDLTADQKRNDCLWCLRVRSASGQQARFAPTSLKGFFSEGRASVTSVCRPTAVALRYYLNSFCRQRYERERKRERRERGGGGRGEGLKRLAAPTLTIFFVVVAANVDSGRRCPHYSYAPAAHEEIHEEACVVRGKKGISKTVVEGLMISTEIWPSPFFRIPITGWKSVSFSTQIDALQYAMLYGRVSHNVVTMETNAIGWPLWLITFWSWYSEFEEIMSIPNACACIIVQKSTGINM